MRSILSPALSTADPHVSQLEYETERAGTFEPLRWLPPNKSVVLGIVSSKFPALEDKDEMVKKVHAAAEVIANGEEKRSKEAALNQYVVISPRCRAFVSLTRLRRFVGSASALSAASRPIRMGIPLPKTTWSRSSAWSLTSRRRSGPMSKLSGRRIELPSKQNLKRVL